MRDALVIDEFYSFERQDCASCERVMFLDFSERSKCDCPICHNCRVINHLETCAESE